MTGADRSWERWIHPRCMDEHIDPAAIAQIVAMGTDAAYHRIDEDELAVAKAVAAGEIPAPHNRSSAEINMQWSRWRRAGCHSFVVGPETAARIASRVKADDVPTAPLPPAYFSFETPPANFRTNRLLRGAYLSRGEIGRITFVADAPDILHGYLLTVLLPSVVRNGDLDRLDRGLVAQKPKKDVTPGAERLASTIAANMGAGAEIAGLMAERLENLSEQMHGKDGERRLTMAAALYDRAFGPLSGMPSPLLPKAARIVLVAADEARRHDAEYASHRYLDTDQVSRTWQETRSSPARLRDDVVILP